MTVERVQKTAELRGIYFNGEKKWRNNMIGYAYEFYTPDNDWRQAGTLDGIYSMIMAFEKI